MVGIRVTQGQGCCHDCHYHIQVVVQVGKFYVGPISFLCLSYSINVGCLCVSLRD